MHEERISAPRMVVGRYGRELRTPNSGDDNGAETLRWLKASLALIIATWRHDLRADLTWMITQIESASSSEWEWQRLRRHVEEADPDFARHLDRLLLGMTPIERKISLLMGLGLPADEIARTLRQPATTVAQIGGRIADRLGPRPSGVDNATP